MFRGANTLNLDSKGRLAIPSRYRQLLVDHCSGELVVTVNNASERCLWLYPMDTWLEVEKKIVDLPSFDPRHQQLKRFLIGYASEVRVDKTGRVLIPAPLREFSLIDKTIYLVGQGNKFEIWNEELWNKRCGQWIKTEESEQPLSVEMEQLSL